MTRKSLTQIQSEERAKAMVRMIERGLSLQETADIFNCSKPLVQQIYDSNKGRKLTDEVNNQK